MLVEAVKLSLLCLLFRFRQLWARVATRQAEIGFREHRLIRLKRWLLCPFPTQPGHSARIASAVA